MAHVHHFSSKNVCNPEDLGPFACRGLHPDQDHLSVHIVSRGQILDLDNVDELPQLLDDLFADLLAAVRHNSHSGVAGIQGGGDSQRMDVEGSAGEHAGDAGKHARLVLYQLRR